MPKVSVQLSPDVHAAVRVRAFREGTSLAELGRRFFENYGGLAAGDVPSESSDQAPGGRGHRESPAASPRCTREARHHINHSGKPCPECGFPLEAK